MNIAYIANARIPTEKAHGFQIMKVCEKLSEAGASVRLVYPARKNAIQENAFTYYGIKPNFTLEPIRSFDAFSLEKILGGKISFAIQKAAFLEALKKIHVSKDEIVYTRDPEVAWFFSKEGRMVALNAHRFPEARQNTYLKFIKNVKKIVCNSKGTAEEFIHRGWKKVCVVPNGVDVEEFDAVKKTKSELRKELSLPEGPLALYAGHLYVWKGIDVVVAAAKLLPAVSFVVVGGTLADVSKYQQIARKLGLNNLYILGHKDKACMPQYLKAADVLLLPNIPSTKESESYTSPIKMFEYMASGVPIVASDLDSLREVLSKENSVLVSSGSPEALVKGIQEALEPRSLLKAERARHDVASYSWRSHAEKLLAFLKA